MTHEVVTSQASHDRFLIGFKVSKVLTMFASWVWLSSVTTENKV